MFICEDRITCKISKDDVWNEWADFSLTSVAQIDPEEAAVEGSWVAEIATIVNHELITRYYTIDFSFIFD